MGLALIRNLHKEYDAIYSNLNLLKGRENQSNRSNFYISQGLMLIFQEEYYPIFP